MQPFSHNQIGALLIRHLAHFIAAIDTIKGSFGPAFK
jgi:hypothetical protein